MTLSKCATPRCSNCSAWRPRPRPRCSVPGSWRSSATRPRPTSSKPACARPIPERGCTDRWHRCRCQRRPRHGRLSGGGGEGRLRLRPEHIDALLHGTDLLMRIATPNDRDGEAAVPAFWCRWLICSTPRQRPCLSLPHLSNLHHCRPRRSNRWWQSQSPRPSLSPACLARSASAVARVANGCSGSPPIV